jgi:hypothetical protein
MTSFCGQEIAAELERLLLDLGALDGEDVVPIRLLDGVDRIQHRASELEVGDLEVVLGRLDPLPGHLGAEVLEQGLGEVEPERAPEAGIDELEGLVGVGLVVLDGEGRAAREIVSTIDSPCCSSG